MRDEFFRTPLTHLFLYIKNKTPKSQCRKKSLKTALNAIKVLKTHRKEISKTIIDVEQTALLTNNANPGVYSANLLS